MVRSIRVDDEVFAKLQSLAEPFVDTPNSTLRRLLDLPDSSAAQEDGSSAPGQSLAPLVEDGRLVEGQELVWPRRNLGQVHHATVLGGGNLQLEDGTVHTTPSSAATHLAGNPQNGWRAFRTAEGVRLAELR